MFRFVALLLVIGVCVQAQQSNNNDNIDEYITQTRQQYAQNIRDYDQRIDTLIESYTASLQMIPKRQEMIVDSIGRTDKRLKNLEILSDSSQKCVQKYRSKMPNVMSIKQRINRCWNNANSQTNSLVMDAISTRTALDSYYKYDFEIRLNRCNVQAVNYNKCVTDAISNANVYTANNRKTFDRQMQNAQTRANGNTDTAFQCSYSTQNEVTSSLAEIDLLTNRCLQGLDNCKPCINQGHSCPNVKFLQRYEVDYNYPLMNNVFYGHPDWTECLMMKILN